jgi:hypothetical protein
MISRRIGAEEFKGDMFWKELGDRRETIWE